MPLAASPGCARSTWYSTGLPQRVEHDAIDGVLRERTQVGRADLVGFHQPQVELDVRRERRIAGQNGEGLAVGRPGHPHRAEFFGQTDGFGPLHEGLFDPSIGLGIGGQHLQSRPGADHIIGQGQHDAAGITVVGHLVARAVPQDPSHIGAVGRIGRQAIGVGPVATIVVVGDRRVVATEQRNAVRSLKVGAKSDATSRLSRVSCVALLSVATNPTSMFSRLRTPTTPTRVARAC